MDTAVTILQVLLALVFIGAGLNHAARRDKASGQMAWMLDVPKPILTTIGALEILGGIGLVAPWATGVATFLTPLAALGLLLLMLFAIAFHLRRGETQNSAFNVVLGVLAAIAAYGRIDALHF